MIFLRTKHANHNHTAHLEHHKNLPVKFLFCLFKGKGQEGGGVKTRNNLGFVDLKCLEKNLKFLDNCKSRKRGALDELNSSI